MKCLSVAQPWAWAIVSGGKTVENRDWPTAHRGLLLIQASKSREYMANGLRVLADMGKRPSSSQLVMGSIVGVVELVDCIGSSAYREQSCGHLAPWGDSNAGWWWVVKNARAFANPIPFPGQLNVFDVPDKLVRGELERIGELAASGSGAEQTEELGFGSPVASEGRESRQTEKLPDPAGQDVGKVARAAQGRLF